MATPQLAYATKPKAKRARPPQSAPLQARLESLVSKVFVDPNGKPYKFYVKDLFPNWDEDARKQLEDGIKKNGGQVMERVPREGFVAIDPSPEWGHNFGVSYKILQKCHDPVSFPCRWVVHWKFIHDTIRLGRLEGRLLREYGFPAVGYQPEDHAQNSAPILKRMRIWSQPKNDVFGGNDQSPEDWTYKCFSTTLRVQIWKGITGDERDQLVQAIQSHHGYTVFRDEEADVILLPDPKSKYKYTPDDIAHLKPLIESRGEQSFQRVKFASWIRMAIREGRYEALWETANVTLDLLARPVEDLSTFFSSMKRKRDLEEVEELVSDESPAKVRRVEGRDGSKRRGANPEPSVYAAAHSTKSSATKPTAPKAGQSSYRFVSKVKQPPLPGKFSSRRPTSFAASPKRLTKKARIKADTSDDDDDGNPTAARQTKFPVARLAPDNLSVDASTNPAARSVGPVASPMRPKPPSRDKHVPHKIAARGHERIQGCDLRTELEEQTDRLSNGKSVVRESPCPTTPEAAEHSATAERLDPDDARTHEILMKMSAESRNAEAAESPHSHSSCQSIDHDLVDLLEDDERVLGNIKEMKEAEYPKLLEIAAIIRAFERRKKRLEHENSEEAVLQEIIRDASPTL